MNYKDIYNDLVEKTLGFTKFEGFYNVANKAELQIAEDILSDAYASVERDGLDYNTDFDGGYPYMIRFREPILEEQVKYEVVRDNTMNEAMIEKHDTLNPKLWDENNELLPEVREKVEDIVNRFAKNLEDDEVKLDIEDICLIGSNASYNYNPTSDLDVHIIADPSVYTDEELAQKIYLAYKALWNNKYDPTFNGIEVELYVEPYKVQANSKGIYSLKDGWLKEPSQEDVPDVDENKIAILAEPYEERFEKVMAGNSVDDIDNLIDDIYLQRQKSIQKDGEFGEGNLLFKLLRSRGRLQALRDRKVELENKEMSIEEDKFNENLSNLFIDESLVEDTIENEYFDLEPGMIFNLGPDHKIKIKEINGDLITCEETEGDETFEFEDNYPLIQSMLFEYDAVLEEDIDDDEKLKSTLGRPSFTTLMYSGIDIDGDRKIIHLVNNNATNKLAIYITDEVEFKPWKETPVAEVNSFEEGRELMNKLQRNHGRMTEDLEVLGNGNGSIISFADPQDTLRIYLDWEGIYGFTDDIIDFAAAGEESLDDYLEEEGIYGYTYKIMNILETGEAFCKGMEEEDFLTLCRDNGIEPGEITTDSVDPDITKTESLNETDSRLVHKAKTEEEAKKFVKFLDPDLDPKIEKDDDGFKVTYLDREKADEDTLEEQINLPGYGVEYVSGYAGMGVNNHEWKFFRTKEEQEKFAKELEDRNARGVKTFTVDNFYHTEADESLNEADKTGLASAAKSVLNRLCRKYKDASSEEIYNKALEVAGRSDYPFVKNNLEAKKDVAIEFIELVREAELNHETDESLKEDTVKQNGKWVNKGKEGTHGKFNTKKEADAQRKAMFAKGYKGESLSEDVTPGDVYGRGDKPWVVIHKPLGKKNIPQIGLLNDDGYAGDIRTFKNYDQVINWLKTNFLYKMPDKKFDFETNSLVESLNEAWSSATDYAQYFYDHPATEERIHKLVVELDHHDEEFYRQVLDILDEYEDDRDEFDEDLGGTIPDDEWNNLTDDEKEILNKNRRVDYPDEIPFESLDEGKDDIDDNAYYILHTGGSIGQKRPSYNGPFDSVEQAKEKAKHYRKNLTPGEREYYHIGYKVIQGSKLKKMLGESADYVFDDLLNESADRHVERGINWTWFYTDSEDDANKWFFELMGVKPNENTIDGPIERNHPGKFDSYWSFRMRNDLVDQLDFKKSKYDIKTDESLKEAYIVYSDDYLEDGRRAYVADTGDGWTSNGAIDKTEAKIFNSEKEAQDWIDEINSEYDNNPDLTRYTYGIEKLNDESLTEAKKLYHCDDCGYEVELSDDEYNGKCPHCGEHNGFYEVDESLNEEVNPEDIKAQALASYLNVTTDDIDNGYSNGIYEIGNEEYFVGTEEEAHDMAVGEVKMSYDDMGLDAFTPRFQEWILDNAIDEGSIDEFVDNEIDYFTNEEPDQNMVDYLEGLTDRAQYVKDTLGPDTFKEWAKDKIDLDKVAEEAIEEDGAAHFIAYYDGNEIDLGDGLYAYRLN